ncbi:hypothetical protein ACFLXQ_00470 [Chloroflexota bacterium]
MILFALVPLFLLMMGAILLGLLVWGFRQPHPSRQNSLPDTRNNLDVWLLLLAVLAVSVFLAYILLAPVVGG